MNTTLKSIVLALLTFGSALANADVEIEAKLIAALPEIAVTNDLEALNQMKGVDVVSAPRVKMKAGSKAKIDLTNNMTIEGQEAIPIGLEFEITPNEASTEISFFAKSKLIEFLGFSDTEKKQGLIFRTTILPIKDSAPDNVPLLIEIGNKHDKNRRHYIFLKIRNV